MARVNDSEMVWDGGRTIRMNTNRREDLSLQLELEDVNQKTISELQVKRQMKLLEKPSEKDTFIRKIENEFAPPPSKSIRKSKSVFHENYKTKEFKKDQYMVMPEIPAYSPVDSGPKTILESRLKKYPYCQLKLTTTAEMKKPKVSALGVLPVRSSLEIPDLRIRLEGNKPGKQIKDNLKRLYNTPVTPAPIPKLQFESSSLSEIEADENIDKQQNNASKREDAELNNKKTAILPGIGTASSVTFSIRNKPAPKSTSLVSSVKKPDYKRERTAESFQSSLVSGEINIDNTPDQQFEDLPVAIIEENIETAVSMAEKKKYEQSRPNSVKSAIELVEEARRISRTGSDAPKHGEPTNVEEPPKHKSKTFRSKKPIKGSKAAKEAKAAKEKKKGVVKQEETEVPKKREERTVDEIIASLKDQSAYNRETEADKKIKELMNKIMLRTGAAPLDHDDKEHELTVKSDSDEIVSETDASRLIISNEEDVKVALSGPDNNDALETSENVAVKEASFTIVDHLKAEIEDEREDSGEDQDLYDEDYKEVPVPYDPDQVWEDLLLPPNATIEDLLSVKGEVKDLQNRLEPKPNIDSKPNIFASSVSFLSSWAPTKAPSFGTVVHPEKLPSKNIHHFCKMSVEYSLPPDLMHAGRKYHAPDKFPSVYPEQPYRFEPGEIKDLEKLVRSSSAHTNSDIVAQRIIDQASESSIKALSTIKEWQDKASLLLGENEVLEGQPVHIKSDESQIYWNPAPPKLGASSLKVKEILFDEYNVEEVDVLRGKEFSIKDEEDSEDSEVEETKEKSEEERAAFSRTILKRHNSSEVLTEYSREKTDATFDDKKSFVDEKEPELEQLDQNSLTGSMSSGGELLKSQVFQPEVDLEPQTEAPDASQSAVISRPKKIDNLERPRTAPSFLGYDDDTLIVPQDFVKALEEIKENRRALEKLELAKNQPETDELEETTLEQTVNAQESDPMEVQNTDIAVIEEPKIKDDLTPAEKALLAGRSYVILPKKRKKKAVKRHLDLNKLEAIQNMLFSKQATPLKRRKSVPNLHKVVERELRVPWKVKSYRASIPNLLDFKEYSSRKRMPSDADVREWVRDIWNVWFDEVFPPTPEVSDTEQEQEKPEEEIDEMGEKKEATVKKADAIKIPFEDVQSIETIADTQEKAEICQILSQEIDKLTDTINASGNPTAFDLCRRGGLYAKIGQFKKSEVDLNRAIDLEPELVDAYWHRHLLFLLQDRKAEALDDLNYIIKKNKKHSGAYRSMAEIYKQQGEITMAIINYSSAIKYNPTDHEAFYQRAQLYEKKGETLLAMEDYTKVIKIEPTRIEAVMKHGMYYFEIENWGHAINDFTDLLKVDPLNATARLYRGRAYAKMNVWISAIQDLSAAIHLDPHNWQSYYQRACIFRKAHPKRALQDFSVSLLLNDTDENIMSYLHRGIIYNQLGKPEDAIPDFESVLKLNKDIAAAHVNLGLIYMSRHLNYHRAIKKFTAAIKVDPTYIRAYVCRAEAYHKIHELKNAFKDFTKAIHLQPNVHHYYMYRGQLLLEMGKLDLAAFCVRHASELGKSTPSGGFGGSATQQAIVQSFLKNYDKAVDALEQASKMQPIAPYFMLLGRTHMKAKQFKDAVSSFQSALDKMKPWKKNEVWPPETAEAYYLSGLCHMELRNYHEALQQFNFAIKFNSKYADAFYHRGLAAVKMRQMKGIQDFNRALAIDGNLFQAYLSRACYYGMKGKHAKAILNCNEAIKLQPKSVRAYLYRGSLKYHIKAYGLAIADLSEAASIDTRCPLAYFNRAVCYHEDNQLEKALTDYGIVLMLGNMLNLKTLVNRGLLYFKQKDYFNALYDFQAAARENIKDHRIHHTLGLCFHKLNRFTEAVAAFTKSLQLKPFFLDGFIARGNVFMDLGTHQGLLLARRDYQRALRLNPLCLPARINLAYAAQISSKQMQAWKHFSAIIENFPRYKPALEGRAIVNLQMRNTFAALQDITSSINCGATAELLTNRGVIHQFMGEPILAMKDYQRAVNVDPTYSLAYFNAGNVYFHTRHFKQALEYYTKATENNPQDESAFLNRAITKVLLHDTKGAFADFKMAAKLSPNSAHIYFNRANLYTSLEEYDKAETEYTKALELKPDDPLMLKRRADVRGKLGRQNEAIADYKRAIDIQTRPHKSIES